MKATALLVLEIDGTVRQGKDDPLGKFVNGPEDVVVFPEAVALMAEWKGRGGRIVGVTNQGGIALGLVDPSKAAAAIMETQRQCGALFDYVGLCMHHPDAPEPDNAVCWCRKPAPGNVIIAGMMLGRQYPGEYYPPRLALMVGDRPEDEECARRINFPFQWASEW